MSVLRRAYIEVEPDVSGFDEKLREKFSRTDPGGKAGKQLGGQLNRALKRLDLEAVDVRANPKQALAAIDETEAKLRALSRNASTIEIKVRAEQGLKEISRFRKTLGDVGDDAAPEFASNFSKRLAPLLEKLPVSGPLGIGLVAAAAAAAPLIGAVIAGAVIGGVGIGGVVGGLTLAAKDTRVKAAAEQLGDRLEQRLFKAGGAFVDPAIKGLRQIEGSLDQIDIEGLFADAAKFVQPLVGGVATAVAAIGGALRDLVANAGAPIRAISDGIAQIGQALASALEGLADNGEEGAAALKTLFALISSGIRITFGFVNALTELYGVSQRLGSDHALRAFLLVTGAEMDRNGFSALRTAEGVSALGGTYIEAAKSAKQLAKEQEQLKAVQDRSTQAQDALGRTLDALGGKTTYAARTSDALATAMDNLYGATIRQSDANESYESSWDGLSASVKANKRSLDIHTESGRANRDALRALIGSTNEAYLADLNAGVAIDKARQKHDNRIRSIEKESSKLGLNEKATKDLIGTYGRIPAKKQTDLILSGIDRVADALLDLAAVQLSLQKGTPLGADLKRRLARAQYGMPDTKRAYGGPLPGNAPHDRADNAIYAGTPGEWVIQRPTVRKVEAMYGSGAMDHFNKHGELPGYARGGLLAASRANWGRSLFYDTNVAKTRIPSLAEAASKVTPAIPSSGRTSAFIVAAAKALVPGIRVLSQDRPGARTLSGNVSYHSLGRAVDFEPSEKLARLWNERYKARTKELISPYQQWNIHNGQRHRYTGAVWNQHNFAGGNAHDHIAMAGGGVIGEPVYGVGRSGRSYSFGERGPETVTPGVGSGEVHFHFHGPVASKKAAQTMVLEAYQDLVQARKIRP